MLRVVQRQREMARRAGVRLVSSDVARLAALAAVPVAVAAVMARMLGPHALRLWDDQVRPRDGHEDHQKPH